MQTSRRPTLCLASCLALSLLPLSAHAEGERPGFQGKLSAALMHESNVFRANSANEKSDAIFVLKPEFTWLGLRGKHRFGIEYKGDYGLYKDFDKLNYNDHDLSANAHLEHSYRLASEFQLGLRKSHDAPGSLDTAGLPFQELDTWKEVNGLVRISYGRKSSKGQLVGEIDHQRRRYDRGGQEFRDFDQTRFVGTFYYRIAPKTRLLFQADFANADYLNRDSFGRNQSNDSYHLLAGVTWEATAKTSGTFKIGSRNTDYSDPTFGDQSGLALSLDATWKPNTYTKLTVGASQDTQASAQQGTNGFERRDLHVDLAHAITPRTLITASALYGKDSLDSTPGREDKRFGYGLGVTYSLRRNLDVGVQFRSEERDSDNNAFDYKTRIFLISLTTRFG